MGGSVGPQDVQVGSLSRWLQPQTGHALGRAQLAWAAGCGWLCSCTRGPGTHPRRPAPPPQICRAGTGRPRRIWLTRHGESQFNVAGKIGGNSLLSPRCAVLCVGCRCVLGGG